MISIVLISHSAQIAAGVRELAAQVSQGRVQIFAAGGLDEDTLGTSVETILQALTAADNPAGTLVLMDLGSALLSAEAAIELLPGEMQARVRLCPAPLMEGAVAAAVQASLGADLETACREAMKALEPKLEQLGPQAAMTATEKNAAFETGAPNLLVVTLRAALHARPAARFVQTAARFDAEIQVTNLTAGRGPVSARSLNAVLGLGADADHRFSVAADGQQASEALLALHTLLAEPPDETAPTT